MQQPVEHKLVSMIYGKGRGWSFSPKDFSSLGRRSSIDVALHRLLAKGTIRRVVRGIYDYPRQNNKLGGKLSPDLDQVASALARKSGWRIQPAGQAALNLLGLSTQVMGRVAYLSDGPTRTYAIAGQELVFEHTMLKESGFRHRESSLIVQALKTLGPRRITSETVRRLRNSMNQELRARILVDTKAATGWIRDAILKVCKESPR